jgi:predicted RNA-binding Zn-ribbon protein involved in translation (DUF1610 family)
MKKGTKKQVAAEAFCSMCGMKIKINTKVYQSTYVCPSCGRTGPLKHTQ